MCEQWSTTGIEGSLFIQVFWKTRLCPETKDNAYLTVISDLATTYVHATRNARLIKTAMTSPSCHAHQP